MLPCLTTTFAQSVKPSFFVQLKVRHRGEETPSAGLLQRGLGRRLHCVVHRTRSPTWPTTKSPRRFDHFHQPPARKREDAGASPGSSSYAACEHLTPISAHVAQALDRGYTASARRT